MLKYFYVEQKARKAFTAKEGRPVASFSPECISFTYGDLFPAMRYPDGKPYRGQVYLLAEIREAISLFGWPQEWNALGPERYTRGSGLADPPQIF